MVNTLDQVTIDLPPARILAVESSCDETAAAVVENGRIIHSNVVASQASLHAQFGGVFPEVASRQHIRTIYSVIDQALKKAHVSLSDMDAIAVTRGPGLPGSLVVGMNAAKGLAIASGLPLVGVNHLEAHLYSAWLYEAGVQPKMEVEFPLMALIVSGGHTELVFMEDHLKYQSLGTTLDDAAGEAFDKVARLLNLEYPGGPSIQKISEGADDEAFQFPRAWLEGSWNFSFSGLKTAVLRETQKIKASRRPLPVPEMAASFQMAVVDVLVEKTIKAADQFSAKHVLVAGGVSANRRLRQEFQTRSKLHVHIPALDLCTDNAAMAGAVGYQRFARGQNDSMDMDVLPNWPIAEL
ncbi:MAG: tRNA (adenosine(37)-N6)-threonylcarbamoyltransferase complex transferase subunit TsaD [Anaerolineales bacterium]|nr:tRNA (adenosine(37)-N6)-threonylcarbamoyltransferase complex transferase subunit TsaD [Anaerolineales bacterium]